MYSTNLLNKVVFLLLFIPIIFFLLNIVSCQDQPISEEINSVDLYKMKNLAEKYLHLLKTKNYGEAFNMVGSKREMSIENAKLFYEEFGDIIGYRYKSCNFHNDEAAMVYEVQYSKVTMDKEIKIIVKGKELQIVSAKDRATSSEAINRMTEAVKNLFMKSKARKNVEEIQKAVGEKEHP